MTPRDFCFWLQGYIELSDVDKNKSADSLSPQQTKCSLIHLVLVFQHQTGIQDYSLSLSKILQDTIGQQTTTPSSLSSSTIIC